MKLAKGSFSWILTACVITILSGFFYFFIQNTLQKLFLFLFIISFLIECFFLIFFRDPHREIGKEVVAVADGVIREITQINDKDIGNSFHISTFMNVYHVHVNRMPLDGTIKKVTHIPGGHIPAFKKESDRNERMITIIETAIGHVKIIQIAGCIARRIVSYIDVDQDLKKGTRIGIIKLGSRVDLIISKDAIKKISVKKGDHVRAGITQICNIQ